MKKYKYVKPVYVVNEEKKTVTCLLKECDLIALEKVRKGMQLEDYLDVAFADKLLMNETYKATTHCHPSDVWDVEVGKRVALEKAEKHLDAAVVRAITRWRKELDGRIANIKIE